MTVKKLYVTPIYSYHMVLETPDGEYMRFYITPAREINEDDLTPVPYYVPVGRAGEEAPDYMYRMYGLKSLTKR